MNKQKNLVIFGEVLYDCFPQGMTVTDRSIYQSFIDEWLLLK